jgi:hypothetical protein
LIIEYLDYLRRSKFYIITFKVYCFVRKKLQLTKKMNKQELSSLDVKLALAGENGPIKRTLPVQTF